jgi:hypothetical protein
MGEPPIGNTGISRGAHFDFHLNGHFPSIKLVLGIVQSLTFPPPKKRWLFAAAKRMTMMTALNLTTTMMIYRTIAISKV